MTTATATAETPVRTREVLQDRWDSAMEWERNGGVATAEYSALVGALFDLSRIVIGEGGGVERDVVDDDMLFSIGELVVARVLELGIADERRRLPSIPPAIAPRSRRATDGAGGGSAADDLRSAEA